ncbi:hypothetical protein [Corallococcus sp. AS-1-12]|uniref:hypothetical protein n=1 Tax=Corallococcus sp. AS-1-12 TaxID=2874598 RepID=UPI001CC042B1|nr:hypothetical protein [Corallococcus sp. AS-1-12]
MNEPRTLDEIEAAMALNVPFGDWRYINDRSVLFYTRRLELLVRRLPEVEPLLAAWNAASPEARYPVLGDTVLRATLNAALGGLENGVQDLPLERYRAVFEDARRLLAEGRREAPTERGASRRLRVGDAAHHPWVWCDEREEDVWAQGFRQLFDQEKSRSLLRTPDEASLGVLRGAVALLEDVLPQVSRSVLDHAYLIGVTDVLNRRDWDNPKRRFSYDSFTTFTIPGALFLSMGMLRNPYKAAESLLHESLHLKLHDVQHTHAILKRGYNSDRSPVIRSLWNRWHPEATNEWPACRSLAAMHVYVHLALYAERLARDPERIQAVHGPLNGYDPVLQKRRSLERAYFLGGALRRECWEELGIGGQRMVDWMMGLLNELGAGHLPQDGNAHLFLDLYEREAKDFNVLLEGLREMPEAVSAERGQGLRRAVSEMLRDELGVAVRIAATLGDATASASLREQAERISTSRLSEVTDAELPRFLNSTRGTVASLLRAVPAERLVGMREVQSEKPLSELVREMVVTSGTQLNDMAAARFQPRHAAPPG